MSLENVSTDDLVLRWDMLIDNYLIDVKILADHLLKVSKVRDELLLIREELHKRNVKVKKDLEDKK